MGSTEFKSKCMIKNTEKRRLASGGEKRFKHELWSRDSNGGNGVVGSLFAANVDEIRRGADWSDGLRHFPDYKRHSFLCFLYLSSLFFFFPLLALIFSFKQQLSAQLIILASYELRRITDLWSINLTQKRTIESAVLLSFSLIWLWIHIHQNQNPCQSLASSIS